MSEIAKRLKNVVPISKPGELYSYQNAIFALSGEVMYKVTGQNINSLLETSFFGPLQMCSTTMDYEELVHHQNVAVPHSKRRFGWKPRKHTKKYYNAVAAGGISASAEDMGKWMRFLLGHHPEVMSGTAIRETFEPYIEIKGHNKYYHRWPGHVSSYYGFGWRIHNYLDDGINQEKKIWHHGGSVDNYRNEIALYPEADLGICVLLNNNSGISKTVIPDLFSIVQRIYDQTPDFIAGNNTPNTIPHL
jgi:beta-lactamase class C